MTINTLINKKTNIVENIICVGMKTEIPNIFYLGPQGGNIGDYYNGETYEIPETNETIDEIKEKLFTEIDYLLKTKTEEPIEYNKNIFKTDSKSISDLTNALVTWDETDTSIEWYPKGSTTAINLRITDLKSILKSCKSRNDELVYRKKKLEQKIIDLKQKKKIKEFDIIKEWNDITIPAKILRRGFSIA